MPRKRLVIPLLLLGGGCAPALQPLPPVAPLPEPPAESPSPIPVPFSLEPVPEAVLATDRALAPIRERGLLVPVAGVAPWQISDSFDALRDGARRHDAQDIFAPRGTPVLAADDGVILRVGTNALGGNVIWAADAGQRLAGDLAHHERHRDALGGNVRGAADGGLRLAYYYAHLERYAKGLREGQEVKRGDVIGYVGTTGNAPPGAPHLHFQLLRVVNERRYSNGAPINPLPFFAIPGTSASPWRHDGGATHAIAPAAPAPDMLLADSREGHVPQSRRA